MTIPEDCARRVARKSWKIEAIIFKFKDDARYPESIARGYFYMENCSAQQLPSRKTQKPITETEIKIQVFPFKVLVLV